MKESKRKIEPKEAVVALFKGDANTFPDYSKVSGVKEAKPKLLNMKLSEILEHIQSKKVSDAELGALMEIMNKVIQSVNNI